MASGDFDRRVDGELHELSARVEHAKMRGEEHTEMVLGRHARTSKIVSLVQAVLRQQSAEQISLAASGAAFWLVISAFPTGAAVVSLFGLVVSPAQVAKDLGGLSQAGPASLGSLITDQLRRVAADDRTGLSLGLAISVVAAVWSASAGVFNLDRAIRYSFGLPRQRYVEARARALLGSGAVVVLLGAVALGGSVVWGHAPAPVIIGVGAPSVLVALTFAIAAMYRFSVGPSKRLRQLLPGAAAAGAAVVVSLGAFAAYLALSGRFAAVYGAFVGLVIGMIGVYLAVFAVLLGAVLNAKINPP